MATKKKVKCSQELLDVYSAFSTNINKAMNGCDNLIDVLKVGHGNKQNDVVCTAVVNINNANYESDKDAMLKYVIGGTLYKGLNITFVAEFWINPRLGSVDLHYINALLNNITDGANKAVNQLEKKK